jgi:hypothetical protein
VLPALPSGERKTAVVRAITFPLMEWEQEQIALLRPAIVKARSDRAPEEVRIAEMRKKPRAPKVRR